MQNEVINTENLIFRDAVASDIRFCLALDGAYQTEHVWQLTAQELDGDMQIHCRRQRLPRPMEARHSCERSQLVTALRAGNCFVVIQDQDSLQILGYLSMRVDRRSQVAYLQDIVIDRPFRRRTLGARLAHVARVWAAEQELRQVIFEIPSTNYPCILFAQALGFNFCGFNDHHFSNRELAVFFSLPV